MVEATPTFMTANTLLAVAFNGTPPVRELTSKEWEINDRYHQHTKKLTNNRIPFRTLEP
jgi:hypothetical protein